jgi:pSer/pThr/pTyr-binding forkhead associated (FHA) protein
MIILVPVDDNGEDGAPLEFKIPSIRVGRGPHNDLILDEADQAASYEHGMITVLGDRAFVICELTANPTFIDGADVSFASEEERMLKPGDIISFGKGRSMFRVRRIGDLAEPQGAAHQKGRAHLHATRPAGRHGGGAPPPLGPRDQGQDRGVYPIVFQVFKGERMVREESFHQPLIRIGRMKSSHLLLDDESVSRTHAVVEVTGEAEVLLMDLDSSSGTAVAGQRVKKAVLNSGDQVEFGKARVIVCFGKMASAQAVSGKAPVRGASPPPPHDAQFGPSHTEVLTADQLEVFATPRIVVRRGGVEQAEIALTKACTTIGRLPNNDIHLDDGAVSGKHAMLVAEAGVFLIIDQHSTNGTYLNGEKCEGESLRDGDVIQIGRYDLVFVAPGSGAATNPPGTEILSPEAARAMFARVGGRGERNK